jgi:hypothetical protein
MSRSETFNLFKEKLEYWKQSGTHFKFKVIIFERYGYSDEEVDSEILNADLKMTLYDKIVTITDIIDNYPNKDELFVQVNNEKCGVFYRHDLIEKYKTLWNLKNRTKALINDGGCINCSGMYVCLFMPLDDYILLTDKNI